jgi:hypothetical protein
MHAYATTANLFADEFSWFCGFSNGLRLKAKRRSGASSFDLARLELIWDQARGGARLCQSCAVEPEIAKAVKTSAEVSTQENGRRRSGGADATTDPTWTTA